MAAEDSQRPPRHFLLWGFTTVPVYKPWPRCACGVVIEFHSWPYTQYFIRFLHTPKRGNVNQFCCWCVGLVRVAYFGGWGNVFISLSAPSPSSFGRPVWSRHSQAPLRSFLVCPWLDGASLLATAKEEGLPQIRCSGGSILSLVSICLCLSGFERLVCVSGVILECGHRRQRGYLISRDLIWEWLGSMFASRGRVSCIC